MFASSTKSGNNSSYYFSFILLFILLETHVQKRLLRLANDQFLKNDSK